MVIHNTAHYTEGGAAVEALCPSSFIPMVCFVLDVYVASAVLVYVHFILHTAGGNINDGDLKVEVIVLMTVDSNDKMTNVLILGWEKREDGDDEIVVDEGNLMCLEEVTNIMVWTIKKKMTNIPNIRYV